ncbi:hypothetical protein FA15DRAFT_676042 [Coprinopsis marcescibilis]|uniref:Uncharacterized protein n=1 Tax=Coprinopsis marcescibilis TaxID=230819 RepID=A0A5C3KBP0_COPMA|nr:hypothetical protein FA15DRAFT_676042 [Coprinopsis marcescibilis]
MTSATNSQYFRRRIGRAASPPTWACYEQIRYDEEYSDSDSDSCSEDEEDYPRVIPHCTERDDASDNELDSSAPRDCAAGGRGAGGIDSDDIDMDMGDEDGDVARPAHVTRGSADSFAQQQARDLKGKQKAVEPVIPEPPVRVRRQARKKREPVYTLRPILTIQRSQGFVWNQDLFVPPYIKDRYIASTSPPNSHGFISTSASSTNSALTDYEVEVVEIRIKEGELHNIIP